MVQYSLICTADPCTCQYYTIVQEQIIYQQILSEFSFNDCSAPPVSRTLMEKTVFKIIRGQLLPEKMRFENTKISPIHFLKFQRDYDLNLCRYLNPELLVHSMRDFASLNFLNRHSFVCGTFFPNKTQSTLSKETKFQIRKCDASRYLPICREAKSHNVFSQ